MMDFTRECCAVLELRQYTMQPGQRDTLITLFERYFIEGQEAIGMTIVGQFRDRARDDRFVFVRGFPDMESRRASLERFYSGPIWSEHRDAANATLIDWDDVLLLRPARPDTMFRLNVAARPAHGEQRAATLVFAGIHGLRQPTDEAAIALFERQAVPLLREQGVRVEALFVTEPAANTYPRLQVREGEHVLVWFGTQEGRATAGAPSTAAGLTAARLSAALSGVTDLTALAREHDPLVVLELDPTSRSAFGHHRPDRR